ncbi:MAG: HIT domain-containing protein [Chloroflexia bacterium]|nr:HIT domain-containing protein [Chloroflexia bacterium]
MHSDSTITPRNRLWTPWRMAYVGGTAREPGCVFCNRLAASDDSRSLILHRGRHAFIILNLYPYNTGHLMVVPHAHVQDPSELDPETQAEMAALIGNLTALLRRVLGCAGFNIGMNIGDAAGAGIAEHLHQHIVPRWVGDANFMPILSSTKVLPELLAATYGKIRAEIARDISGAGDAKVIAFVGDTPALVVEGSALPVVALESGRAVWKSVLDAFSGDFDELSILGWAGHFGTGKDEDTIPALAIRALTPRGGPQARRLLAHDDLASLSNADREIVQRALDRIAP